LKLAVIQKRMELGKARRSGGGLFATVMATVQWLLARLNAFRPMRAFKHYTLQHGPLMSAGIGFNMFFSITGLLATGFSIAGLVLRGQPALLDTIVASVAQSAPGLLKVNGGEGLVDPQDLLNPDGLGLDGPHWRRGHGHHVAGLDCRPARRGPRRDAAASTGNQSRS
jgi:membrane protein